MSWKMVFCLRRLPTVDIDEFSRYWREEHATLFRQYAEALAVRRYTQSHRLDGRLNEALRTYRGAPDGYDGVAEVWFDSIDELRAALTSEAGRAAADALIEDERRFIDHAESPIWIAEEIEIELPRW
ncbi:MAG TPA: EthD domain-containing protein [Jatrophihabitantaceae bacterium]|nr:EthD domain-containing protein [Jatrophihabitantaceae bacterium]